MLSRRFFEWLLDHRAWVVVLGIALCAVSIYAGRNVRADYAVSQFFPVWDPERLGYEEFKDVFPKEDAQFALFWQEDRPPDAELYRTLQKAAALFEEVGLDDVKWFGNVRIADNEIVDGESVMRIHELVEGEEISDSDLRTLFHRHRDDPLYRNTIWNESQSLVVLVGYLSPDMNNDATRRRVEGELSTAIQSLHAPGRRIALAGIPYVRSRALKNLNAELPMLLGIAVIGLFAIMYLFVRSGLHVLLCLAAIVPAYLMARGAMGVFDWPVTLLTSFLPIIVLAIGFSDTIHLLTQYHVVRAEGADKRESIIRSFSELASPCLLTSLTTAVGFLCLASTRIEIVVDFAIVMALAMLLTWGAAMVFFPVLLSFGARAPLAQGGVRMRWLDQLIALAARWSRERSRAVLALAAALVLVFGWFSRNLEVDAFLFDLLKRDHPIMQNVRWIESEGFGLFQVNVFIEGSDEHPLYDVAVLEWIDTLQRYAEQDPLVAHAGSFLDHLRQVRRGVLDGRDDAYRLPDSTPEAAQLLLLADSSDPTYLEDVYIQSTQQAQLVMSVQDLGSKLTLPFLDRIETHLRDFPPPTGVRARLTGTVKLGQMAFGRLTEGFAWSLAVAILLIFGLMAGTFRSFAWGLVALVPNLMPLIMLFGLFALGGYAIKPSLVIVFATAFGVAVDDSIHMLGVLRRLRAEGSAPDKVIERALHTSGRAIVITTLVIGSGFAVLQFSNFEMISVLGLLTPFALVAALAANLFVLPAFLYQLRMVKT